MVAGKGPTLVYFPANGGSVEDMQLLIERIAEKYRFVGIDPPGREPTEWPDEPFSFFDDLPKIYNKALKMLRVGPHVVMGHSMGGMYALHHAKSHPQEVQGLVLAEGFVTLKIHYRTAAPQGFKPFRMSEPVASEFTKRFAANQKWETDRPRFKQSFWPSQQPHDARPWVAELNRPILAVIAENGQSLPKDLVGWRKQLGMDRVKDLAIEVIPNSGHWMMLDDPKRVGNALLKFLDRVWTDGKGKAKFGVDILEPGSRVEKVVTGRRFTEGPVVDKAGNLFFSDNGAVMRVTPQGELTEFARPSGGVNGMMFDAQGRLYLCQPGKHRIARLDPDGTEAVLASQCNGFPLRSPNDLCIDAQGRVYFTDTLFRHKKGGLETQSGVLRIDAPGKCVLLVDNLRTPNGIIISPDFKYIYVSDRGTQKLHRYAIQSDGGLRPDRIVFDFTPNRGIDGMCIDSRGNIYGAAGRGKTTGLFVVSPNGKLLLHRTLPNFATNATFGGQDLRDLYVTTDKSVYRFRTLIAGTMPPLHLPKIKFPKMPVSAVETMEPPPKIRELEPGSPKNVTNSIGMKLVLVTAGKFIMGSSESEKQRQRDEREHLVSITQSFLMGTHEVTQQQYKTIMGHNPSYFCRAGIGRAMIAGKDTRRFPVESISWEDAREFCRRLSGLPAEEYAGRVYRLPTEAQWEYASRAGSLTTYSQGETLVGAQANFDGKYPYATVTKGSFLARTTTVGSYQPNPWGLYDMQGNVWEWCLDRYEAGYYQKSPQDDPPGAQSGRLGILRGGSWISSGGSCRPANRHFYEPECSNGLIGFRVVCGR